MEFKISTGRWSLQKGEPFKELPLKGSQRRIRSHDKPDSVLKRDSFVLTFLRWLFLWEVNYLTPQAILPEGPGAGRAFLALLFDLASCRVWLFSLQQLLINLPFPIYRSLPWIFFLFHCSSISNSLKSFT